MKPNIIKAGICSIATAAVLVGMSTLVPVMAPATPDMATKLAGKTVFLDPGHQGPNHTEDLSKQVENGRGGTKDCQTTGMSTTNGIPEHTINWNVAQLVKSSLESLGARVVLSRQDDIGWGGCIDDRARAANRSGAAVAVSIHADSAPPQARGFHLIVPQLPIPDARIDQIQSGAGLAASQAVRDGYLEAGFPSANYAGVQDGLQTRADVAGPALTAVPAVLVEMGNGANAEDAALLETQEGQLRHAIAITTGVAGYLLGSSPALGRTGSADRPAVASEQTAPAPPAMHLPRSVPVPTGHQTSPLRYGQTTLAPTATSAVPAPNGYQTAPGHVTPQGQGASTLKIVPELNDTQPQTSTTPGTGSLGGMLDSIMQLLLPLSRSLGMDNSVVTSELSNLAYILADTLLRPSK